MSNSRSSAGKARSAKQKRTFRGPEVETVVSAIHNRLANGRYSAGHRLVESDLMKELGVSRTAVREALRRLEAEDLIEIEPYKGASIKSLKREDIEELFQILEPLAVTYARLAARNIDEGNNRRIAEESLAATRKFRERSHDIRNFIEYVQENRRFHQSLRDVAGNRKLNRITLQVELQLSRVWLQVLMIDNDRDLWTEGHEAILLAVLDGDGDEAARQMRSYSRTIRSLFLSLPDNAFA